MPLRNIDPMATRRRDPDRIEMEKLYLSSSCPSNGDGMRHNMAGVKILQALVRRFLGLRSHLSCNLTIITF